MDRIIRRHRLYLIFGNHELVGWTGQPLTKGELIIEESLGLRYRPTGQLWLAAHGHQADPWCDPVNNIRRRIGRAVYGVLKLLRSSPKAGDLAARLAPINQTIASARAVQPDSPPGPDH